MTRKVTGLAAALCAACAGAGMADGPTPRPAIVAPAQAGALQRACLAAGARAFDAPPASIFVYDPNPAGGIGMWAGGGQFICRPAGPDRIVLIPVPAI